MYFQKFCFLFQCSTPHNQVHGGSRTTTDSYPPPGALYSLYNHLPKGSSFISISVSRSNESSFVSAIEPYMYICIFFLFYCCCRFCWWDVTVDVEETTSIERVPWNALPLYKPRLRITSCLNPDCASQLGLRKCDLNNDKTDVNNKFNILYMFALTFLGSIVNKHPKAIQTFLYWLLHSGPTPATFSDVHFHSFKKWGFLFWDIYYEDML